jgi:ubiquinol-cytochrome c reductase cytochrome b subunit
VWRNDPQYAAMQLFQENCATCHEIDGRGGEEAPSLSHYNDREWLRGAVRTPRSIAYFGGTKAHTDMEAYSVQDLPDEQLDAVVEFLIELREQGEQGEQGETHPDTAAWNAELAKRGRALWESDLDCSGCHSLEPGADGDGAPVFAGRGTRAWIERVIRNSSAADLYGGEAEMPKFAGKLSDPEITALADYVFAQGVVE